MTKILGIEITNPNKKIYKNVTKIEVINYYKQIAQFMLPYLKNRPLSVVRCHSGIFGQCFFKKHPQTESNFVKTFLDNKNEYFYVTTQKEIIFQAQMGTIEFHPWGCTVQNLNKPDIMIFDLDPDEKLPIQKLRDGVKDLKQILDQLNLKSFLKTSGGKGYHIVVPFLPCKNWDTFSNFAKKVALLMEHRWPQKYTTNIRKNQRKGKIFIDFLRNKKGATCVAPYSLRSKKSPCVSMPISWNELEVVKPDQFTIFSSIDKSKNNPWKDFFKVKQKII